MLLPHSAGAYDKECDPVEEEPFVFSGGITFYTYNTRTLKVDMTSGTMQVSYPFLIYGERIIFHSRQVLDSDPAMCIVI